MCDKTSDTLNILIAVFLGVLQFMLERVTSATEDHELTLKVKMTKFMIISKKPPANVNFVMNNQTIETFDK